MNESTFNNLFGHMQALEALLLSTIRAMPEPMHDLIATEFRATAEAQRSAWLAEARNEEALGAFDAKLEMLLMQVERPGI